MENDLISFIKFRNSLVKFNDNLLENNRYKNLIRIQTNKSNEITELRIGYYDYDYGYLTIPKNILELENLEKITFECQLNYFPIHIFALKSLKTVIFAGGNLGYLESPQYLSKINKNIEIEILNLIETPEKYFSDLNVERVIFLDNDVITSYLEDIDLSVFQSSLKELFLYQWVNLPVNIDKLINIETLALRDNFDGSSYRETSRLNLDRELEPIKNLNKLKTLDLSNNKEIYSIPSWIFVLDGLENLILRNCIRIRRLPPLHMLLNLKFLSIDRLEQIKPTTEEFSIPSLHTISVGDLDKIPQWITNTKIFPKLSTINFCGYKRKKIKNKKHIKITCINSEEFWKKKTLDYALDDSKGKSSELFCENCGWSINNHLDSCPNCNKNLIMCQICLNFIKKDQKKASCKQCSSA